MNYPQKPALTPSLLWLMAISSGLIAANLYYNQPLLSLIAKDFSASEASVSKIAMLTQVGFALGLLIIIPLGDLVKRKRLIIIDLGFLFVSLLGMALSQSLLMLYFFSLLTGFTSVIPQVFVPMAAKLAEPEKRTQSIGFVMSGLLFGILGSRVLSGFIGNISGWRSMFFIAAVLVLVLWYFIALKLPEILPEYKGTYKELMKSVAHFAISEPKLQAASFRGAFLFASFSAFWMAIVFHLAQPPFNAGSAVAGSFGLVGIAGAMMAGLIGKLAKKVSYFKLMVMLILSFIASWVIFGYAGYTYVGLIIGVVLLDAAMQGAHILNQSSIFSLKPEANNRLNTVYMTTYFIGGASGTYFAGLGWAYLQWTGVLAVGMGFGLLALLAHVSYRKHYKLQLLTTTTETKISVTDVL